MADFKPADDSLTSSYDAPYNPAAYPVAPETSHGGVVSFLSSNEREGRWELPRHFRALAVMGNVELDLREAIIGIGVSFIEAVGVMGNIEITVPPDVAVESDGDSLLGSFVVKYKGVTPAAANGLRTIRITGTAYASSVEITVKGPDEGMLARLKKMSLKRTLAAGEYSE
jgi:cell wall-active antibiotic response 4TMS protein YvqF